jgi:5-(carboxyamino)imidazole ribonucleotide synthase
MAELRLKPGDVVGILGGGQLGRMLAIAAAELGLRTHIYCPDPDSPAFEVATACTVAPYDDSPRLADFASAVDVITYEFENVPAATAAFLETRVALAPPPQSLAIAQDRLTEKEFLASLGIALPAYARVDAAGDIYSALARTGRPAILKSRRLGYDGKGQATIRSGDEPPLAWRAIGETAAVLEALVPFEREVSVILARGRDGTMRAFDISENRHKNGILAETRVPANVTPETAAQAVAIAEKIAAALDYVGVLAVEMFVVTDTGVPRLLVNEIAPRVHNSGHWTLDAAVTSQFEQHIRAIAGWPLGDPARLADALMVNLIGEDVRRFPELLAEPDTRVHLYGKSQVRPGRKMGHATRIIPATRL